LLSFWAKKLCSSQCIFEMHSGFTFLCEQS
jgi:hypothetical protein